MVLVQVHDSTNIDTIRTNANLLTDMQIYQVTKNINALGNQWLLDAANFTNGIRSGNFGNEETRDRLRLSLFNFH